MGLGEGVTEVRGNGRWQEVWSQGGNCQSGAVAGPQPHRESGSPRSPTTPACSPASAFALSQYPEGYLEALAKKEKEKENRKRPTEEAEEKEEEEEEEEDFTSPKKGKRRSKSEGRSVSMGSLSMCSLAHPPLPLCSVSGTCTPRVTPKKTKVEPYRLTAQQKSLIKQDQSNTKLWTEILKSLKDGPVSTHMASAAFLNP